MSNSTIEELDYEIRCELEDGDFNTLGEYSIDVIGSCSEGDLDSVKISMIMEHTDITDDEMGDRCVCVNMGLDTATHLVKELDDIIDMMIEECNCDESPKEYPSEYHNLISKEDLDVVDEK